ncbi:MAG TPA: GAF domain-containing protein [Egicoccus sp.]|nr:GAF domain-containing protein [Egicoccus sp.]HSK22584.1 GAF domain-containing protein [Egicoccus sp.]
MTAVLTGIGLACLVVTLVLAPPLERRRRLARQRRTGVELRVALLETARSLPGHDLDGAARLACEGLCSLGFDAAAVSVRRGRVMVPMHSIGLPRLDRPIPAEGSFAARCLDENRTLVVDDYASLPTRRPERADLRTVVLTPVRADGRPVATLNAARRRVDGPTPQEIAIAETVAAHLGRVFATQARVSSQEQLLARMRRLDEMRTTFVEQVSDELHGRLGSLRDLAEALDPGADGERRRALLAGIATHSAELGTTIDAMLDFSRFQADRPVPAIDPITVRELLEPLRRSGAVAAPSAAPSAYDVYVGVDASLVRHGLELIIAPAPGAGAPLVREEPDRVLVVFAEPILDERWRRGGLVVSLAEQLLLTGGAGLEVDGEVTVVLPRWSGT